MLRMAHRIAVATPFDIVPWHGRKDRNDDLLMAIYEKWVTFQEDCRTATCIIADNVSDYILGSGKMWVWTEMFPQCIPIHSPVLVEWVRKHDKRQVACLMRSKNISEYDDEIRSQFPAGTETRIIAERVDIEEGTLMPSDMYFLAHLDENGDLLEPPSRMHHSLAAGDETWNDQASALLQEAMSTCLLTMSFANCKNVTQSVSQSCIPDRPWIRKHKPPEITYHVLNINPMKEVLRTEGGSETNGIQKALHICRGHFRRCERPFGRDKPQTMWISSHTRGNAEHGVVLKDYKIGKPE